MSKMERPLGPENKHYWLASSMAKATGVDLVAAADQGQLSQSEWADAVQRCRGCGWVGGCQAWMGAQVEGGAEVPAACVNSDLFQSLKP